MKEKVINVITTAGVILLIVLAVCSYPIKVKVENGEMTCENLLGKTIKCR